MPVREIKTTIALDGEQQFKKALADASREMRVMDSELKAVTAAYRANGDGAEYFANKQRNLKSQIAQQETIIKSLEQAVEDAAKAYGETSSEVDGYTIKLNNARTKLSHLEKQLSDTDREVEELGRDSVKAGRQIEDGIGDAAQEAEKDVKGLVRTLQDDLSAIRANTTFTAIGGLWDMAKGAYTSAAGFVEGTVEYRRQLSFLEQNAETNGFDFDTIKQQLLEVTSITGDSSAAIETLSNLMAAPGMDKDNLTEAVDLLAGAVIKFPETMKFESLADSIQETLATGEASGQFAELLGRLGYSVEDFNTAMEKSETKAGDLDIVMAHLAAAGMKDVYEQWQKNNESMQDAAQTQAELELELADFGSKLEGYIVTPTKKLLVEALKYVNDTIDYAEKNGAEAAAGKIVEDFGKALEISGPLMIEAGMKAISAADQVTPNLVNKFYDLAGIEVKPEDTQKAWEMTKGALGMAMNPIGFIHGAAMGIINEPIEITEMPVVRKDTNTMQTVLDNLDMDAYYTWIDQQKKETAGKDKSLLDILIPPAYAEEKGAEAAQAFLNGMEMEIDIDQSNPTLVKSALPTISPVQTQKEIEAAMKDIESTVTSYEDDMEEVGEDAGDAMAEGFETAWAALENKAYMAGVSTGAAYAAGLDSQLGAISAAAARLSAVASAGISRAAGIARMGITLNLDGRKVAEGLALYTDEVMATAINFD